MRKDFIRRFNIPFNDIPDAQERFIQRIDADIFNWFESEYYYKPDFIKWLSLELGEGWHNKIRCHYPQSLYSPKLEEICEKDFHKTLLVLELIHLYFVKLRQSVSLVILERKIEHILDISETDIGIFWKDGKFYKSGVEYLDQGLIIDTLDYLNDFPDEKIDFKNALKAYENNRTGDAVGDCYNVIEGLARKLLGNSTVLDGNVENILRKLQVDQNWKSLLKSYISYANDFKRHASDKRHSIDPDEVEAFLYLTGLIVRLCIRKKNNFNQ